MSDMAQIQMTDQRNVQVSQEWREEEAPKDQAAQGYHASALSSRIVDGISSPVHEMPD